MITIVFTDTPFVIDNVDGKITTKEVLDREHRSVYTFPVTAVDKGEPPLSAIATITVLITDDNDNSPVFDQDVYMVTFLEKSPVGSVLLLPKATDVDEGENGQLMYSLVGVDTAVAYFSIATTTGLISIAQQITRTRLFSQGLLGGTTNDTLTLMVRAQDGGNPPRNGEAQVQMRVDEINDDAPVFGNITYQVAISEEASIGKATTIWVIK